MRTGAVKRLFGRQFVMPSTGDENWRTGFTDPGTVTLKFLPFLRDTFCEEDNLTTDWCSCTINSLSGIFNKHFPVHVPLQMSLRMLRGNVHLLYVAGFPWKREGGSWFCSLAEMSRHRCFFMSWRRIFLPLLYPELYWDCSYTTVSLCCYAKGAVSNLASEPLPLNPNTSLLL